MITSTGNAAVKAARRLSRRPEREATGTFLVEGPQAVREAVNHLSRLFVTAVAQDRHADVVAAADAAGVEVMAVTDAVLDSLADTRTPQGLVGVATLERRPVAEVLAGAGLAVALWQAQDPGNVGTVIRSADAAGADAVVLTGRSADPRNPKAVRASAGSVFHIPVADDPEPDAVVGAARRNGLAVVALVPRAGRAHTEVDLSAPTLLLFGNEARGLPTALVAVADTACEVPIRGGAESLNLAATAAVVLFEAARQRTVQGSWP